MLHFIYTEQALIFICFVSNKIDKKKKIATCMHFSNYTKLKTDQNLSVLNYGMGRYL